MQLRPYQNDASDAVVEAFAGGVGSVLVTMPTGLGKTILFCDVAKRVTDAFGGRAMILAHREELIFQAADKIERVTGHRPEIEMAEMTADTYFGREARYVVSSIQTQIAGRNGGRMTRFAPSEFGLVIVDEAHHATAASYRKVLDHYTSNPQCKVLGVTATPDRSDEQALGQIFESVAYQYEILDAIRCGWLVPLHVHQVFVDGLDFSSVRTTAGDLNGLDLARVMEVEGPAHEIASTTIQEAGDRKTLVFASSVAHADLLTDVFNRHLPGAARIVTGKTPKDERRGMLADYAAGSFQFLVNVGVATEGFDEPGIEVVAIARPTKSRSLYAQMIGRGTRPLPGVVDGDYDDAERKARIHQSNKRHLTVLDFTGNCGRHKLVGPADVLGGKYSDEVVELAAREIGKAGVDVDVLTALEDAEAALREEHKRAQRDKLRHVKGRAQYRKSKVNPFDVVGIDLATTREPGWAKGRMASEKQVAMLDKMKVPDPHMMSMHEASCLIDKLMERRKAGKCTFGQSKVLNKYGYDTSDMSFGEASDIITAIANNGWKPIGRLGTAV